MITCKVDDSAFRSKMRRMAVAVDQEKVRALRESVSTVVETVIRIASRDTNRYVRGWVQAGQAALRADFPMPPLQGSRLADEILKQLQKQFQYWLHIRQRYEKQGRTRDRWYRDAVKKCDRALKEIEKYAAGGETTIAFDLYEWQRAFSGRTLTTVRHKIYGGTGRTLMFRDEIFVELHNMEPHCQVVERRFRVMARASIRYAGSARRQGQSFVRRVARRSGFGAAQGY